MSAIALPMSSILMMVSPLLIFQCELVADRFVSLRLSEMVGLIHDPAGEFLAGRHAFDHDHRNGVFGSKTKWIMNPNFGKSAYGWARRTSNSRLTLHAASNMSQHTYHDLKIGCAKP
jgi:hypothetical protein